MTDLRARWIAAWDAPGTRRFRRNPGSWVGLAIVLSLIALAVFAPWIADRPPDQQNLRLRLEPPSLEHPFGTDEFGRSMFARVAHGARVFTHRQAHHFPEVIDGVAEAEAAALLRAFFSDRRNPRSGP